MQDLQWLAGQLTSEIVTLLLSSMAIVIVGVVTHVGNAFAQTEKGRRIIDAWKFIENGAITGAIEIVYEGEYNVAEALVLAVRYEVRFNKKIDPRMAYVIDRAEKAIAVYAPFDFDFDEVYHRVEALYIKNHKRD